MNKKIIINLILSSAICAPYAHAMGLLPRASQVAKMVMNPAVRSALTAQAPRSAIATAPVRNGLAAGIAQAPKSNNSVLTQSTVRAFSTNAARSAIKQSAPAVAKAVAVGVAIAGVTGAVVYAEGQDSLPEDFLIETHRLTLLRMLKENPERAKQFAELVTIDNIVDIRRDVLGEIMKIYPESATWFAQCAAQNITALAKAEYVSGYGYNLLSDIMMHNKQAAALFTQSALENMTILMDGYQLPHGLRCLKAIMTYNKQAAADFAPYAVANFSALVERPSYVLGFIAWGQDDDGYSFIEKIMERNPAAASLFTACAVENIAALMKNFSGADLLRAIVDKDPAAAKQFTPYVVENFAILEKSGFGSYLLVEIVEHNPAAAALFTSYAAENFAVLAKDYFGSKFLRVIVEHNPAAASLFTSYAAENFAALAKDYFGVMLLQTMMETNPPAAKDFMPYAVQNMTALMSDSYGLQFLRIMMEMNPLAAAHFTSYVSQNVDALMESDHGKKMLIFMMVANPQLKKNFVTECARSLQKNGDKASEYWKQLFYKFLLSETMTPTELWLLYAYDEMKEMRNIFNYSAIAKVSEKVVALERKYQDTHYTFTHGRNRAYHYVSSVYGTLWKYAYNTEVPEDFIFTHTKDAHDPLTRRVLMHEERKLHEENITERANIAGEIRNRRLFLNTQLFGNMHVGGSSSFSYFLKSDNASGQVKVRVKDVFGQFGQQAIYEKYQDEFEALEEEHQTLSRRGELLVVAVPKERVRQDVMCMNVNGDAAPEYMINGKMTNDVQEILEARKKDPSIGDNELNFTLAMTETAALDPKSGIKIISVQDIDQAAYAAWQTKVDALMAKIETEFKASWHQKMAVAKVRNQPIYDAVTHVEKAAVFHRMKNLVSEERSAKQ